MGFFSRKKPASEGLLGTAIGTQLTLTLELGYNADSEAICAFFSAYIAAHDKIFGASGDLMPLFPVLCFRALVEQFPAATDRISEYGDAYVMAKKTVETFGLNGSWEAFHRIWGANHTWSRPNEFLIPHIATMQRVVDAMLQMRAGVEA